MNTPDTPEQLATDIDYIMTEFAKADTTITPEVMAELNELSSTQETHQDDSKITRKVKKRLTQCNTDERSKIRDFLEALGKSIISASDNISIIGELKMELATNSEKSIDDILVRCHNNLIQSISNTRGEFDSTMNSGSSILQ